MKDGLNPRTSIFHKTLSLGDMHFAAQSKGPWPRRNEARADVPVFPKSPRSPTSESPLWGSVSLNTERDTRVISKPPPEGSCLQVDQTKMALSGLPLFAAPTPVLPHPELTGCFGDISSRRQAHRPPTAFNTAAGISDSSLISGPSLSSNSFYFN